jgi:hypothetical protein
MRVIRLFLLVAAVAALILAGSAAAGTVTKHITLYDPAKVSGKTLEPGTYRVDITDDGKMTVKKGKEVVAEAKGEWVEGKAKAPGDTFVVDKGEIKEIRLEGKTRIFQVR